MKGHAAAVLRPAAQVVFALLLNLGVVMVLAAQAHRPAPPEPPAQPPSVVVDGALPPPAEPAPAPAPTPWEAIAWDAPEVPSVEPVQAPAVAAAPSAAPRWQAPDLPSPVPGGGTRARPDGSPLGLGLGPAGEAAAHLALVGSEPRGAAPAAPAAGPPLADASEVDEPPVPVGPRTVRYPPHAEAMQLEGRVRIEVILSAAGLVESARVLDADPPGVFDAQALVDVLGWTFRPATRQGQPVRCRATTELVYALR